MAHLQPTADPEAIPFRVSPRSDLVTNKQDVTLKRKIGAERTVLMLPLNVVMVGRISGDVNPSSVSAALESFRQRHPLLVVRVEIDDDGTGWYVADGIPEFTTPVEQRQSEEQWIARVQEEFRTSFPIETGALVRCTLIHSPEVSEIILCGHHAICDGMSLGYLLRDLLKLLAREVGQSQPLTAATAPHESNNPTAPSGASASCPHPLPASAS